MTLPLTSLWVTDEMERRIGGIRVSKTNDLALNLESVQHELEY